MLKFKRARHQLGSLQQEERKRGPNVWVYFYWDQDIDGKRFRRKVQIGTVEDYPTEAHAQVAADSLRLTINTESNRQGLQKTTMSVLWEHYKREELPNKELSTQDAYQEYMKNWVLPRWGNYLLEDVKTVKVEQWIRSIDRANGTRAKIKCVMSALYSHAVRWEFTGHNPISSGVPVGAGGKRSPSMGVRVSAKREKAPLILSPEQVKEGLCLLQFRDQLLVLLDGALGIRRGELGGLRWMDCDFDNDEFNIQSSYYWRHGGHLKTTKTEGSAKPIPMHPVLKKALLEWREITARKEPTDFVFPSRLFKGTRALDLAQVLKRKIRPAFEKTGIKGVGWHTFRHSVGAMLAEMDEHQLTIRDYLRHANLHVTNKYLQATANKKRGAQNKLVSAILPTGTIPAPKAASF